MDTNDKAESMKPVTVAAWVGTILVSLVPLLNVAFLLYWSFGRGIDPNRRNFSRAGLIVIALLILLTLGVLVYMVMSSDPYERIKEFMMLE